MAKQKEAQTLAIGPWVGGLNERFFADTGVAQDRCADNELLEVHNFEVDNDGTLYPRRGIHAMIPSTTGTNDTSNWVVTAPGLRSVTILGSVKHNDDEYIVIAAREATQCTIWTTNDPTNGSSWHKLATLAGLNDYPYALAQYNGLVYICRSENAIDTGTGGWSFPESGIPLAVTLTAVPNMPKGNQMFVYKDRLFICSGTNSKVSYSKATDPTIWASPDGGFFFVSPGDGEVMLDVVVANNQFYIFKERKSFRFVFSADPAVDGSLLLINDGIGGYPLFDKDRIFLVTYDGLYQVINDQFINLSRSKLIDRDIEAIYRPMAVRDTLYFTWSRENTNWIYSMNLNNGAFATLDCDNVNLPLVRLLGHKTARFSNDLFNNGNGYIIEPIELQKNLWYILDNVSFNLDFGINAVTYVPTYRVTTKAYAIGDVFTLKKIKQVFFDGRLPKFTGAGGIGWPVWKFKYFSDENNTIGVGTQENSQYADISKIPSWQTGKQGFLGFVRATAVQLQFDTVGSFYGGTSAGSIIYENPDHFKNNTDRLSINRLLVEYSSVGNRRRF